MNQLVGSQIQSSACCYDIVVMACESLRLAVLCSKSLGIWDSYRNKQEQQRNERRSHGHKSAVNGVALSHDGSLPISRALDGIMKVWSMKTISAVRGFEIGASLGRSLAVSADNSYVACTTNTELQVWSLDSDKKLVTPLPAHLSSPK